MSSPNPVILHNLIYWSKHPVHLNHLGYPSNAYLNTINRKLAQIGDFIMARKNSSSPDSKPDWQVTFVQLKLNEETANAFAKWMERKEPEIALDVAAFMSNGHKTSITWDNENKCWIVSATCKEESSKNYNHCLSSRSSEWWEAMCMNVFKHNVVCAGGSWVDKQSSANWG
jgi:hypothetical protein